MERPDLIRLERKALESDAREVYRCVSRGVDHRLGIAAAVGDDGFVGFCVELSVRVVDGDGPIQVSLLEAALALSRRLRARGYRLASPGDGWMTWEKDVPGHRVAAECAMMRRLVAQGLRRVREPTRRRNEV